MSASPSVQAVARVAYLASDSIFSSDAALPSISPFVTALNALSSTAHAPISVQRIPFGGDSGAMLLSSHRDRSSLSLGSPNGTTVNLTSYLTLSHSHILHHLLPHLPELVYTPTVLHVAISTFPEDDLADILVLRAALPFCIYSRSAQDAHDNALLASRLARTERRTVLHVFHVGTAEEHAEFIDEESIKPYLFAERVSLNRFNETGEAKSVSAAKVEDESDALVSAYDAAALATASLLQRPVQAVTTSGAYAPRTVLFTLGSLSSDINVEDTAIVELSLLKPLSPTRITAAIPSSARYILVCEQVRRWSIKWTPLYLEVVSALQADNRDEQPRVRSVLLGDATTVTAEDVRSLVVRTSTEGQDGKKVRLTLGALPLTEGAHGTIRSEEAKFASAQHVHIPRHEASYTTLLETLFGARLEIANSPSHVYDAAIVSTSPEFTLGRIRGEEDAIQTLERDIKVLLSESTFDGTLHRLLSEWIAVRNAGSRIASGKTKDVRELETNFADRIVAALEEIEAQGGLKSAGAAAVRVYQARALFRAAAALRTRSRWIVGSDAWAYDLGASGLHHAIASGLDVNILLLDSTPYSRRQAHGSRRGKQDVGLYAMNHGDVYVASVAVYASYAQVLQALMEADAFPGPSVVLAYLPYTSEESTALEILKETKMAVDAGYWPLYRWNPAKDHEGSGNECFSLDSDAIKNELQRFLDRQNHLSQLVRARPRMPAELVSGLGEQLKVARRARARKAYEELLTAIDAPPLTVLYASDGGKAEKVAKRLAMRAKMRGLSASVAAMDTVKLEDIAKEPIVLWVTSVAGQGEFPQNGRAMVKALNAAVARKERPLEAVKFSVFAMGDTHYWPRPEDAHYYNKAGKDLDARLESLGAQRVIPLGLGDDQDADGPETGYRLWEPQVWKALGVDEIQVQEAEPEPITNEHIKVASQYLRGTIKEGLEDTSTGALAPSDTQLTKFHGIYQQDDRDIRDERAAQGAEPAYSFMIRVRMPGGVCRPDQWLLMDQIADEHGCGTFKITTRQTFQFHGVIKGHLKPAIQDINRALLDTLAACGDVNRNVIVSAIPSLTKLHAQVYAFAKRVSEHLLPRTTAYHEIWLDKKLVAGDALKDIEPLYGEFYLPRKFKVAVAVPPTNDVDIFANDVGFIAIVGENDELVGFNVTAGGGMGVTHGNKKTYPRAADVLGFCTIEQGVYVAEKIMLVQRDNGNREDRKNARLKYTMDRMGVDVFKAEVEERLGYKLQPARPYAFDRNIDDYGWHIGEDGKHHFTCFIENGRIQDEPGKEFKTALREIAKVHKGAFRCTANQHLLITDIATEDLPQIKALLARYKLDNLSYTGLRLSSSACVAFPTCGLAMAESERYLPILIDKVETICEENGLRNDSIVMRMTGCPNGCARPYLAEVAFVGKAPGTYSMLLGGGYHGERLNKIYRETVTEPEILAILRPMIKQYALERREGEHFGDFVIRAGYIAPTTEGKAWYDKMGGEGQHREVSGSA
ncbi:uncharacterized protein FIBRA_02397 [Fibroporia radiculosa]|uniref:assimilatory sulfite reductase (NADPH) n=1 Tax=Fibroporia radiculosa TaxID=599839 RepID=J4HUV4_9APHY|nr:uncharacterized protein FIBRA_02397 [Fibroporia radiculosa]CCM00367.1 predicted protein [Fibroporia radiculosa]